MLTPLQTVRVAVLAPPGRDRQAALYVTRALAIGDRPRFDVTVRQGDALPSEVLDGARVAIVSDAVLSAAGAGRLAQFVEAGGGLLIALGPKASTMETSLLPGTVGRVVDRARGQAATLGAIEFSHPVFEPFRQPRSGEFSTSRYYGYRSVTVERASGAAVLARFDDGAPALVERRVGRGRVLVWTTSLDLAWNDLALKPVFLPFVHQIVRHLASYRETSPASTVGEAIDVSDVRTPGEDPLIVLAPSGARVPRGPGVPPIVALEEAGFYEVREPSSGSAPVLVVAGNVDRAESDPSAVDPEDIRAAVGAAPDSPGGGSAVNGLAVPDDRQERAQRVWWYLLFAGMLLLGAETAVSHRIMRVAR